MRVLRSGLALRRILLRSGESRTTTMIFSGSIPSSTNDGECRRRSPGSVESKFPKNKELPVFARLAVVVALCFSTAAFAQIKIGLMVSATGPTSAIGIPQKNTGDVLPQKIGDVAVEYISLEDGGDTTRAVQNIKKLVQENNIDALIGPSTTPNAFAILDVIADAKVPMMATVGTSAVVEPLDAKKRWVFKTTQNDDLIASALIRHMIANGVKTIGFIGFNDAYGENWYKVFGALADKAGIRIIASERYARNDQSVTGQALKLIAAKPDAILIPAVGGPEV